MQPLSLRELEAQARQRLDPAIYDFFAGGADDELTLRANESAFAGIALLPRALRGRGEPKLEVSFLGGRASMPVLVAPTAFHRLAHSEGEKATARAAARAGTVLISSMASTLAIEEVTEAARAVSTSEPNVWFQLYIQPDLGFTESLVRRAEAAGCTALVVSVDSPTFGRRERDLRNRFLDLPPGLCCENLRESKGEPVRSITFSPELSWEHLDWLRQTTSLKMLVKGLMHPADARLALAHGVDAIVVSNHGGRQLDGAPASVEMLAEIADEVEGRVPLLMDGGIRRGTDVVKALALGATAVAVGRPVLWGLAVGGEDGVGLVLEMLRAELARALALCGCGSPVELSRDFVRGGRGVWR